MQGRIVPKEKIIMEPANRPVIPDDKANWTQAFKGMSVALWLIARYLTSIIIFILSGSMKMCSNMGLRNNWILIVPARDQHGVDGLVQTMNRTGGQMGFSVSQPLEM